MSKMLNKLLDNLFGAPAAAPDQAINMMLRPNRKQRRINMAMALKSKAAPARLKHEKRGADGRSSKGRAPHRSS